MSDDSIFEYSFTSDSLSVEVISVKSKIPSLDSISNGELLPIRDPVKSRFSLFYYCFNFDIDYHPFLIVKVWYSRSLFSEKENNNHQYFKIHIVLFR